MFPGSRLLSFVLAVAALAWAPHRMAEGSLAPVSLEAPFGPGPVVLCDSSGLVWELTFDPSVAAPGTFLVHGFRDTLGTGFCALPVEVFGSYAGSVLSITVFDSAADPCVSAHLYMTRTSSGGLTGFFVNETGASGSFWLDRCDQESEATLPATLDPQLAPR